MAILLNSYYLIPSLPTLRPFDLRNMNSNKFLGFCAGELTPPDYEILSHCTLDNFTNVPRQDTFQRWLEFEKNLRDQLAILRIQKLGLDPAQHMRNAKKPVQTASRVVEIFNQESPVAKEKALFQYRWTHLRRMESGFYFTFDNLVIYYLKLQLLEQWNLFNQAIGRRMLDQALETGRTQIKGMVAYG